MENKPSLHRVVSLPALTLYGLGTIIGAGIYVLVGEVSALAGQWMPLAFLLAAIIASFTALSFCELSARHPKSAGEVVYVNNAFHRDLLSKVVGYMVLMIGIISSATIARGFVGYAEQFIHVNTYVIIFLFVITLTAIAIWGIAESVKLAMLITFVEIFGLLAAVVVGGLQIDSIQYDFDPGGLNWSTITGVFAGAFLAFYAYIGFEDMVNLAEETKDVRSVMPKAIIIALVVSVILYTLVTVVILLAVPMELLSESKTPLVLLFEPFGMTGILAITIIAMVATLNGSLVQIIKGSRVLYGMAQAGLAWQRFATINATTKTPIIATIFIGFVVLFFALWLPLATLASITSFITLLIFILVNASLVVEKRKQPVYGGITFPIYVPILGVLVSAFLVLSQFL